MKINLPMKLPLRLSENAITVLESRYLLKNDLGQLMETPQALFERVAEAVASVEGKNKNLWKKQFFEIMADLRFLPNTPTLINAGQKKGQLSACYVLPLEDSLEGIYTTLKNMSLIQQSGGGTGFSFSNIRSSGEAVKSSRGNPAAGPIEFLKLFHQSSDVIKQGGVRSGANMAVLKYTHPNVMDFIDLKKLGTGLHSFNLSVGLDQKFFQAYAQNGSIDFMDPHSGKKKGRIKARELMERISESAWHSGDPGLVFLDRMAFFNPTPTLGEFESTNPCGEQPLLPYESCNLGSLNVVKYWDGKEFLWNNLAKDVQTAVRFLDNVIEVNSYPVKECETITKINRKIGLGVMGFADLLLLMQIPYDSHQAEVFAENLMGFVFRYSKKASHLLAKGDSKTKGRGPFKFFQKSLWKKLGYPPLRNACTTSIAPTGSISLIAGVSSGIEPVYSAFYYRHVLSGKKLKESHFLLPEREWTPESAQDFLSKKHPEFWRPAHLVSPLAHLKIQAAFQKFSDSAVSKTINLPASATKEDIQKTYLTAYALGCKGITVFRDQSKNGHQVLSKFECIDC